MRVFAAASSSLLSLFLCLPASAAPSVPDYAQTRAGAIFHASGAAGASVVVVTPGATRIFNFDRKGTFPTSNPLVRIASTSKLLAAHLALQLEADGRLSLDQPVDAATPVTLRALITHTGGIPRQVPGDAPADAAPWAWPTAPVRAAWLAQHASPQPARASAQYSNLGYDLLADALARVTGQPYTVLLRDRITEPLKMNETTSSPTPAQCARLMAGAAKHGACADTSATAGTGGLYSTPADMATWMRYMLGLHETRQPGARALETLVRRADLQKFEGMDKGGVASGIGYGWVELAAAGGRPRIMQKTGGGLGFLSYMALVPEQRVGVFLVFAGMAPERMEAMVADALALLGSQATPAGPASRP